MAPVIQRRQPRQRTAVTEAEGQLLKRLYYDSRSSAGYASIDKLTEASNLPRSTVRKWLQSQPTYTLHAPARSQGYPTRRYIVHDIDEQWQADLADMSALAEYNKGYKFILTVIDIFTRYAWARALRSKRGGELAAAFADIFTTDGRIPRRVQTDQGKEFENREVRALFARHGIELFSIKSAYKAAIVERFNRTLKGRIWRHFTANISNTWATNDVLRDAVYAYNHSKHRTLKRRPVDIHAGIVDEVRAEQPKQQRQRQQRNDLQVGDKVRLSKVKSVFARGYPPQWTEEYFIIVNIDQRHYPTTYRLQDSTGVEIEGSFYREEIQPITFNTNDGEQDAEFMVEKVLRRQRRPGEMWAFVKWLGYPPSMNSWVRQRDLRNVTKRW